MPEEQLKVAAAEATAQVEENVEEILEEDLEGFAGGGFFNCPSEPSFTLGNPKP